MVRKKPFKDQDDPIAHMVELLAAEAANAGTPFSEAEKLALASGSSSSHLGLETLAHEDFRQRDKKLIEQILERERRSATNEPKSFGNSLEWAGDGSYPEIVALTESVVLEMRKKLPRAARYWLWIKDGLQLMGCGLLVVLGMLAAVIVAGFVFHWK
jgi:hypothetical protein